LLICNLILYSPDGKKIRSKPQLARQLGEQFDLSAFDFRSGRINHSQLRKSKRPQGPYDFTRGLSVSLNSKLSGCMILKIFSSPEPKVWMSFLIKVVLSPIDI
jgi:hypothetical protein